MAPEVCIPIIYNPYYSSLTQVCDIQVLAGTRYNQKCDVYSLGITIWEVFSSKVPYYNQERKRHDIIEDVCKKSTYNN